MLGLYLLIQKQGNCVQILQWCQSLKLLLGIVFITIIVHAILVTCGITCYCGCPYIFLGAFCPL